MNKIRFVQYSAIRCFASFSHCQSLSLRKCLQKKFAKHVQNIAKHPQNTAKQHLQNTAKHPQNTCKTPQNIAKHHKTDLLTKQTELANKPLRSPPQDALLRPGNVKPPPPPGLPSPVPTYAKPPQTPHLSSAPSSQLAKPGVPPPTPPRSPPTPWGPTGPPRTPTPAPLARPTRSPSFPRRHAPPLQPLTPHLCRPSPPITMSPLRPPRPRPRPRPLQATPRTLPPPPRLHRTKRYGAPFPCRRTSHAPPTPRPPTTSGPRSRSRTPTFLPSRTTAAACGSLGATPHPMFHLQTRTRPPAALPAQATGALISLSLRLPPPPPLAPALSPAPTSHRPPISRNLRIPLRPPHCLPPHPARRSWFVPASPRILPLAILLQQATPAAPPLRPLLPAFRPPPRRLAVNPLHLWLRAPGRRLRRAASAREHAVASLRPPHLTHA